MRRFACLLAFAGCSSPASESSEFAALAAELDAELAARSTEAPLEDVPSVRAARRALAEAQVAAARIGAPVVMADAEHAGRGADHETELMVAIDVALLAGGGRLAAERAEAKAAVVEAEAALAAARFSAQFDLLLAFLELDRVDSLREEFDLLAEASAPTLERVDRLAERGWLAPERVAAARAIEQRLTARRDTLAADRTARVAALAIACGRADGEALSRLPVDVGSLEAVTDADVAASAASAIDRGALLRDHPALRVARADWLAAEAAVRVAAARRWPALLVGPKAVLASDDWMLGGLARLELPWPPAAEAAVEAARRARDDARAALASALAGQIARIEAAAAVGAAEWHVAQVHAATIETARATQFRAATARFAADPATLPEWTMAFEQRAEALSGLADARAAARRARLGFDAARGRLPALCGSPEAER
jgi:hypothetical protein